MDGALTLRELSPEAHDELELVAARMRLTLEEVLGEERGRAMYTLEWLRERVRYHLDPGRSTATVWLAELEGRVVGHSIVRLDRDDALGGPIGLFSTTYVEPSARRAGIADRLVERGEAWLLARGMRVLCTDTSSSNEKLIRLFEARGYGIVHRAPEMVRLAKRV